MFHLARLVRRMLVHNQKHLALNRTNQPLQESQEHRSDQSLLKDHKAQCPPIGYRRDRVAAEALARACNHRRLSPATIGTTRLMIRASAHLVAPVNFGSLKLGLPSDGLILFFQPAPDGFGILLKGPAQWLFPESNPDASDSGPRSTPTSTGRIAPRSIDLLPPASTTPTAVSTDPDSGR